MAASTPAAATIEHIAAPAAVINTPHSARVIAGSETYLHPHARYVHSVTEQHGLQVQRIVDDEELGLTPWRVRGERGVSDVESFLAELVRRPLDEKAGTLWGNAEAGIITAVYNDHVGDNAAWRDDILGLKLRKDGDWVLWHNLSGKYLPQTEFGDAVEELLHTVVDPDQAELLEVIDSIRASSRGEFESSIVRGTDAQRLTYYTDVTASAGRTGQLEVPKTITLQLRPWEGHEQTYRVDAWFRLKVDNGRLTLAVKLKPTRQIVRNAWVDLTTKVTDALDGKLVYATEAQ